MKRLIDKGKFQKCGSNKQATLRENNRLSRSALPAYEKGKCIFYQLDKKEKLYALGIGRQ